MSDCSSRSAATPTGAPPSPLLCKRSFGAASGRGLSCSIQPDRAPCPPVSSPEPPGPPGHPFLPHHPDRACRFCSDGAEAEVQGRGQPERTENVTGCLPRHNSPGIAIQSPPGLLGSRMQPTPSPVRLPGPRGPEGISFLERDLEHHGIRPSSHRG